MANGLLGAIANPQQANVVGQFQLGQQQGLQQEQQEFALQQQQQQIAKQEEVNRLASEILGQTTGGKLAELANVDPQVAIQIAQGLGIPLDQPGRLKNIFGTAQMADAIAKGAGPEAALSFIERQRTILKASQIETPIMDTLIDQFAQDPVAGTEGLAEFVQAGKEAGILKGFGGQVSDLEKAKTAKLKAETAQIEAKTLNRPEAEQLKVQELKLKIQNQQAIVEERKQKAITAATGRDQAAIAQVIDADSALNAVDDLLKDNKFKAIYGLGEDFIATILPGSVAAEARRDQLVGLLSLEARGKLEGSGAISDFESRTLGNSATILSRPGISEKEAGKELKRVRFIFEKARKKALKNPAAKKVSAEFQEAFAPVTEEVTETVTEVGPQTVGRFQIETIE